MTSEVRFTWRTGAVVLAVAVVVLAGMITLSMNTSDNGGAAAGKQQPTAPVMADLQFAVWGSAAEIKAYEAIVADYNASSKDTTVTVDAYPDAEAMLSEFRAGNIRPDLYLLPRGELAATMADKANRPLLDLINAREIPVGDDFARDAVQAFSVNDDLQCLPYTVSPLVIYYNKALVDFDAMAEADLPVSRNDHAGWNLAELRAAAEFASKPRQRTRGIYIEPTLDGLAPFVYSAGGKVYDDEHEPSSTALGEEAGGTLRATLELLRDPTLTLTSAQLKRRPALEWFKAGRLGMIAGYRDLTPELRAVDGLEFDVMPFPNLGAKHTVGEFTGVCLTPGRPLRADASANFLSYLSSDEAVARLTATGYVQPAVSRVALGDDFQQPGQQPEHASVFTNTIRWIVQPPLLTNGEELAALLDPEIRALFTVPALGDLQESFKAIDEKSRLVLDPTSESEQTEEPEDPDEAESGE